MTQPIALTYDHISGLGQANQTDEVRYSAIVVWIVDDTAYQQALQAIGQEATQRNARPIPAQVIREQDTGGIEMVRVTFPTDAPVASVRIPAGIGAWPLFAALATTDAELEIRPLTSMVRDDLAAGRTPAALLGPTLHLRLDDRTALADFKTPQM